MAEGFAKKYLGDMYEVYSAGIEPVGVHPLAIQVMKEIGIDISNQSSDFVSVSMVAKADYIVTLCKDAKERCPVVLPRSSHYPWSFDDPTKVEGTQEEIIEAFRHVRDQIEEVIQKFAQSDPSVEINFNVNQPANFIPKQDIGEKVKQIREGLGLSVKECAELLESTEEYLLRTEKNI